MIKMIIQMNNEKIMEKGEYSPEQIIAALDRIFFQKGIDKKELDLDIIEYVGHENPTDFANFGKIMLGLKDQAWFMENAKEWFYCSNDDSDDPEDFEKEDLLVHYGRKAVA